MKRKFYKRYNDSFQACVIRDLRENIIKNDQTTPFFLNISENEFNLAEIFSNALGVETSIFIKSLMASELSRMLRLKKNGATFSEMNDFYNDVIQVSDKAKSELKKLVANFLEINLKDLKTPSLIKHAKKNLGIRINNYVAYRLANFDGKSAIEIIFYIDKERGMNYSQAWLGINNAPIKSLLFESTRYLNEFVHEISIFANVLNLEFCHVGFRGLSYER